MTFSLEVEQAYSQRKKTNKEVNKKGKNEQNKGSKYKT